MSVERKILTFILVLLLATTAVVAFLIVTSTDTAFDYIESAERWSGEYNVDIYYILATISVESGGRRGVVSNAGASGIMQLMPKTAEWLAERLAIEYDYEMLFDADYNIRLGSAYLGYLSEKFEGDMVFCAYNAGETTVKKWLDDGTGIRYRETSDYLKKIRSKIISFKEKIYLY